MDATPQSSTAHRLFLALANFNPFGFGYLLTGRWKRWIACMVITAVLRVAAQAANASAHPVLWGAGFLAWSALLAWDIWRLESRHPSVIVPSDKWLPYIAVGLAVLSFGSFIAYRQVGVAKYRAGMQAYENRDYSAAYAALRTFSSDYRFSLNPDVMAASDLLDEVSALQDIHGMVDAGQGEQAMEAIAAFQQAYPASPKAADVAALAASARLSWAESLVEQGDYELALSKFKEVQKEHAGSPEAEQARAEAIEAELGWGEALLKDGQYKAALAHFEAIQKSGAVSPQAQRAADGAAAALVGWASELEHGQQYEAAIDKYQQVTSSYGKSALAAGATKAVPGVLLAWAKGLGSEGHYLMALDKLSEAGKAGADISSERQRTLEQLAKDTGEDGQALITTAMADYCRHDLAPSHPAAGVFHAGSKKVNACDFREDFKNMAALGPTNTPQYTAAWASLIKGPEWVPADLRATSPGELRYAATRIDDLEIAYSCNYVNKPTGVTGTYEVYRQKAYIEVFDMFTGKSLGSREFYGKAPSAQCPKTIQLTAENVYLGEGKVDEQQINDWLRRLIGG